MLSKVEAGTFEIESGRADLAAVTRRAVDTARPLAEQAEVTIELDLDEPALVAGDDHRLGQVVDNLLSNAIKFSAGGGRIRIAVSARSETVSLEVADSGIGIPPEDSERLFERMYRASGARRRHIPGTGLGLTIVKAIVDAHHGRVSVSQSGGCRDHVHGRAAGIRGDRLSLRNRRADREQKHERIRAAKATRARRRR